MRDTLRSVPIDCPDVLVEICTSQEKQTSTIAPAADESDDEDTEDLEDGLWEAEHDERVKGGADIQDWKVLR